jgi:hypothetical protein
MRLVQAILGLVVIGYVFAGFTDARADDAGVCTPNAERAPKMKAVMTDLMKLGSTSLASKESLESLKTIPRTIREGAALLHCDEGALSGKDQADTHAFEQKAFAWADAQDKAVADEEATRAATIVPICEATWGLENARAELAQEKANPSGVHDLARMHTAGEAIQYYQALIAQLRPQYAAVRHHAFTDWHTEGACVAASKQPN